MPNRSHPRLARRAVLAGGAALLTSCAGATGPATGFAFSSPEDAAALRGRSAMPAAGTVQRAAARALQRTPKPMARLHVEGTLPGQGIFDESAEGQRELDAMRDLAITARVTGNAAYDAAAARFLAAWAETYRPSFNPIDETRFESLMLAWDLLSPAARAGLPPSADALLRSFAEGYPRQFVRGTSAVNNWHSHRVKIAVLASFSLGEPPAVLAARVMFDNQLRANIDRQGEVLDFAQRDALHYVVYSLEPLMMAVLAARRHGQDWYGAEGGRLGLALEWLRPYAEGRLVHEEYRRTTVEFDRIRRAAGLPGFGGPFQPVVARRLYGMAARVDPQFAPLAQALRTNVWDDAWLEVLWPRA